MIRRHLLLLVYIISFSSHAELPDCYVQINYPNTELSRFKYAERVHLADEKNLKAVWSQVDTASTPDSLVYQLTPSLTVVTKPLGTAKNNASVTFYSGSLLLYTVTVTQTAPISISSSDLILGTLKIEQGLQLTLQIPSSLQPGSVFLQATFSDLNIPSTTISAMVATWNL